MSGTLEWEVSVVCVFWTSPFSVPGVVYTGNVPSAGSLCLSFLVIHHDPLPLFFLDNEKCCFERFIEQIINVTARKNTALSAKSTIFMNKKINLMKKLLTLKDITKYAFCLVTLTMSWSTCKYGCWQEKADIIIPQVPSTYEKFSITHDVCLIDYFDTVRMFTLL